MQEQIYLHAIGTSPYYNSREQLNALETICSSGSLLSLRKQNRESKGNFSGLDYISLCDFEKREIYNTDMQKDIHSNNPVLNTILSKIFLTRKLPEHYNSYNSYIHYALSLAFPKEKVDAIEPEIIRICTFTKHDYDLMSACGKCETKRYSDYPDEVQVKNEITLDKMCGVMFPTEVYVDGLKGVCSTTSLIKSLKVEVEFIKEILYKYNFDVPVYDNSDLTELNNDNIEMLVRRHK